MTNFFDKTWVNGHSPHSADLKRRFSQGFTISFSAETDYEEKCHEFLRSLCPNAKLCNSLQGTSNYHVGLGLHFVSKKMSGFFDQSSKHLPPLLSDGMRCHWLGLCLFYSSKPSCVVSQLSWFWAFLFHKFSNCTPHPTNLPNIIY